jgi:PAS domain-containing protein
MDKSTHPLSISVKQAAIDEAAFALGVIRLSSDRRVRYMNRAMREMLGGALEIGGDLFDLELDPSSRNELHGALDTRFEYQHSSTYRVCVVRPDQGTRVRMRICATPEYDEQGFLCGSIGFVFDESLQIATSNIHRAIQEAPDARNLFEALCRELHDIVGFDSMLITGLSQGGEHLQRLFEDPAPPDDTLPTKWWPMPSFVKAMMSHFEAGPLDLDEMFRQPDFADYADSDPAVAQFRRRDFKYSLRLGVYRAARLIATISLLRSQPVPFTSAEHERCVRLPISQAIGSALALERNHQLQFGLGLIDDIGEASERLLDVAKCLVDRLGEHYGWEHVSLFQVDDDRRVVRLVCQSGTEGHRLPEGFEQATAAGLLGVACASGKAVRIGNVRQPGRDNRYLVGMEGTMSEMVLPVPGETLRWLLNIESTIRDAFSDEEQESVELLLRVAGFILDRTEMLELKSAIFRSVADGVIQTNAMGVIQEVNPAAERLLGRPSEQLTHRSLALFLRAEAEAAPVDDDADFDNAWNVAPTAVPSTDTVALFVREANWPSTAMNVVHESGELVSVLMSAATLPAPFGGKVFVASDLTEQKQAANMESMRQVFRQVASEIRVPLALAASFLGQADSENAEPRELAHKALRQIRKADLPLERVIRIAAATDATPLPCSVFDLRELVAELAGDLPASDARDLLVLSRSDLVLARGARHELMFCLQSVVAYLLNSKSQDEQILLRVARSDGEATIGIRLHGSDAETAARTSEDDDSQRAVALAEPVLAALMQRMGGSYAAYGPSRLRFRLTLASGDKRND